MISSSSEGTGPTHRSTDHIMMNVMIQRSFIEAVVPCLLQSTQEQKVAFLHSIIQQLKVLLTNRPHSFLLTDPDRTWLQGQSLVMRIKFIGHLLPLALRKENRSICKYDDLVITLFRLFVKQFLLVEDGEDLFRLLLELIHVCTHTFGDELINGGLHFTSSAEDEEDEYSISGPLRQKIKVSSFLKHCTFTGSRDPLDCTCINEAQL